ncbi:MAG: hypothetical protein QXH37_02875 [Candidatus Bathyarchaeia archaeon]
MNKTAKLGVFLIILGILLVIHHIVYWQRPFDIADMLHHEFFEAILFTAGITLLMTAFFDRKESARK